MTLACIRLIDVWNWLNNSQLVSTLLILLFGTFAFESWLKRKEANREMIWWLINHIEEYAVLANDYWSEHPTKETKQLVRAARLKSEYSVLMTSVDNVNGGVQRLFSARSCRFRADYLLEIAQPPVEELV